MPPRPTVSVVIAHYEQAAQLARTWAALCAQTLPARGVVIADDGSASHLRAPGAGRPCEWLLCLTARFPPPPA